MGKKTRNQQLQIECGGNFSTIPSTTNKTQSVVSNHGDSITNQPRLTGSIANSDSNARSSLDFSVDASSPEESPMAQFVQKSREFKIEKRSVKRRGTSKRLAIQAQKTLLKE